MKIAIFGAQGIALGAYRAIRVLYPKRIVECFIVSDRKGNPTELAGIPVVELSKLSAGSDVEIMIATPENVMPEIEELLKKKGLHCYVRLDSKRWGEMMERYYLRIDRFLPLSAVPVGFNRTSLAVYMAKFYKDKALSSAYDIPAYIHPLQVGAALCTERVAELIDCEGENISYKNVNYSELTGLYWIWKNRISGSSDKYAGLVHYRRILELTDDDILRLADNDVDVILPYPMPYEPNIEEHHRRYIKKEDWCALLTALNELQPVYAENLNDILNQQYMYNYNIIIAKETVLSEYCEWLFPILERVEELSVPAGRERADRYIGYMGETLETLYFMYNKNRLNIVHAGCRFIK
jgi:hypothetical protein